MLVSLRREYANLVTSGTQLFLLFAGFWFESRNGWLGCLSVIAAISIFAWLTALRKLRAIRDTPTSKIASAAQGYIELVGSGKSFGDTPLLSKHSLLPCLWYRYTVERQDSERNWKSIESGESHDSFVLRDDTGECVVNFEQAEILTKHRDQWIKDGQRYTEWKLINSDTLYAIGEFRTRSSIVEFNSKTELNTLIAEWKKDPPTLHKRFDLNNDGELDMNEWLLARQAAKREVTKKMHEAHTQPDLNILAKPQDGKLFLLSNFDPEKLSRRYLLWSWAHVLIFFSCLGGISWWLQPTTI
ncbi:MAG: hypothetical protein ABL911_11680 [Gallionella sp.]|nr:hypothetical protein [Gallionella sp.]